MNMQTRSGLALLMALCAAPALAVDEAYHVSAMGSYVVPDADRNAEFGVGGHLVFGVPLRPSVWLELNGFGHETGRETSNLHDYAYGGGIDFALATTETRFQPFLIAGAGAVYEDILDNDVVSPYVNAGLGAVFHVTPSLGIRGEGRYYVTFNDESVPARSALEDGRFNLGLQYDFGRPPPPPPPVVVPPPAPVVADSDGDGVVDTADKCPNTPPGVAVDAQGCELQSYEDRCPYSPEGFVLDERGCIVPQTTVLAGVTFEFDSARLTPNAKTILRGVARALKNQPELQVAIGGHTDALGPSAYNLKLSQQRASAVLDFLVSEGVEAARLSSEGYGEFNPVANNDTEEGRELNRRVEFSIR